MGINIVQSFWSKPFLEKSEDHNARFKAGWQSTNLFFYSALLSCLSLKKQYQKVTLYTDSFGKDLFQKLQIPYTSTHTALNDLHEYPSTLWALGKIYTYAQQKAPFIHVDMDVFIWDQFPIQFLDADIYAQNIEYNFPRYKELVDILISDFNKVPKSLYETYQQTGDIWAFNAGVMGGTKFSFFKDFAAIVFEFIDHNLENLTTVDAGLFNMVYEQMLGYNLAKANNLSTSFLYSTMNSSFSDVMKFHLLPQKEFYIHTVGDGKKSLFVAEQIEARLRYEYPDAFENLQKLLEQQSLFDANHKGLSQERYGYLKAMYQWIDTSSWDTKMNTQFSLHPQCSFEEKDNGDITVNYISPQDQMLKTLELEDWDLFLLNFDTPTTIADIIKEISNITSISSQFTLPELENKLYSFVMDKCLYHEILIPEFIK